VSDVSFTVDLVTPEGQLFSGLTDFTVIPAYDGEMGFLYLRAPLMTSLGSGEMRVHVADSEVIERFAVHGGFAGTDGSHLVVLATRAQRLDAYDLATLKERRAGLEERLAEAADDDPEQPYLRDELAWVRLVDRLVSRLKV